MTRRKVHLQAVAIRRLETFAASDDASASPTVSSPWCLPLRTLKLSIARARTRVAKFACDPSRSVGGPRGWRIALAVPGTGGTPSRVDVAGAGLAAVMVTAEDVDDCETSECEPGRWVGRGVQSGSLAVRADPADPFMRAPGPAD